MQNYPEDKKFELIEKLGEFSEKEEHLAPIAARILAIIILAGKRGITFDEIVCGLEAGKSTVSCHLEMLQGANRINYYMKEGDRKRYFRVNRNAMRFSLVQLEEEWEKRRDIYNEVLSFQTDSNNSSANEEANFDISFLENFVEYTDEVIDSIKRLRNKLEQKKLNNK